MISGNEVKLVEIFRVVLEFEDDFDVTSIRRLSESKWDSLAQLAIVSAIESEFGIKLDIADIERITSFASTKQLLKDKGFD